MSTVRCPECHRALNLPEMQEAGVVCCPLCRHTFTPPFTPPITPAAIPIPTERIQPSFPGGPPPGADDALPPLRSHPPIEDEDYVFTPRRDERQLPFEYAASWMNAAAWTGLLATIPCCGTTALERSGEPSGFAIFLACLIVAFLTIMAGARAMRRQGSYRWAVTGVVLTFLTTLVLILMCLPVFLRMFSLTSGPLPFFEDNCCGVLLVFPSLLVILCGLVGGFKGLHLLLQPGTRELFDSPPE